ncbi:MAG: acetylxylan esterase [Pirellulales bacterium]|nr:acetylxylan esterase [Pirellulales bacterium]
MSQAAPPFTPNYDEAQVPAYTLPDPLVRQDGTPVTQPAEWPLRRAEILELFANQVYGKIPTPPLPQAVAITEAPTAVFNNTATRQQRRLTLGKATPADATTSDPPSSPVVINVLIYLPANAGGPAPIFIVPNFDGNQAIHADPAIHLASCWLRNDEQAGIVDHKATEKSRGVDAASWPLELILSRGYGVATFCYCDVDPDFDDGFQNGLHPHFYPAGQTKPLPHEGGSISAWAYGCSRVLDFVRELKGVDRTKVVLMGHSRLGKTALWAGANDERFAIVISNNSGEGGAAITRRCFGETIERINTSFPHWFCANFKKYNLRESELPVDAHQLIALIAPRPVYVASAEEDPWADPRGEFLAAYHAGPVYKLLGKEPLPNADMPTLNQPLHHTVGYHFRTGKHAVTEYDWRQYLDFCDKHFR